VRALADEQLIRRFMRALGSEAREETAPFPLPAVDPAFRARVEEAFGA
jgi:hypothetical protein